MFSWALVREFRDACPLQEQRVAGFDVTDERLQLED
jgi:hypothetical protein